MKNDKILTYKDVMYGDIVAIEDFSIDRNTYDLVRTVVPCKVVGFTDGNTILEYTSKENEKTFTVMQEFMPFEITKEFLEKNGFNEIKENVYELNFGNEVDKIPLTIIFGGETTTPFTGLSKPNCTMGVYENCPLHIVQHILNDFGLEKEFVF